MREISRRELLRDGAIAAGGFAAAVSVPDWLREIPGDRPSARDAKALRALAKELHGSLLLPGDAAYREAAAPANGRYRAILPLAIAQCADEADVVTCVRWASNEGVRPVVRGGGHSYAGYSTTRGLLIDLGRLDSVSVDRTAGTAVTGGAAKNQDLYDATHDGPLFLPGGHMPRRRRRWAHPGRRHRLQHALGGTHVRSPRVDRGRHRVR